MRNRSGKVTVQMLIDSLSKFPPDAPVEVAVGQYNQRYPIAWCAIKESIMVDGLYATMLDGRNVRLEISLPEDNETYMSVRTLKKKALWR